MPLDLSRRSFLGGVISIAGVAAMPKIFAPMPTIYGDLINDDTAGLNALFNCRPVRIATDMPVMNSHGWIYLSGGKFFCRDGFVFSGPCHTVMVNCQFRTDPSKYTLRIPFKMPLPLEDLNWRLAALKRDGAPKWLIEAYKTDMRKPPPDQYVPTVPPPTGLSVIPAGMLPL